MTATATEFLIAALGGSISGSIVAWLALALERRHERRRLVEKLQAEIALLVSEAATVHWRIAQADFWRKQASAEARDAYDRKRDAVRDRLYQVPNWQESPTILNTLYGLGFEKETDRNEALHGLAERLTAQFNPVYAGAMKDIHRANMEILRADPEEYWRRHEKLTTI